LMKLHNMVVTNKCKNGIRRPRTVHNKQHDWLKACVHCWQEINILNTKYDNNCDQADQPEPIDPPIVTTFTIAIYYYSAESWYSFYHPTEGRRLSRPSWLVSDWDGLPARRQSPIQVLTGPTVEQLRWFGTTRCRYATPPTKCQFTLWLRYKVTNFCILRSAVARPASGHCPPDSSLNAVRFTRLPSIANVYTDIR